MRDGLTNIKMPSRQRYDPPTPAEKVGNHPFMFSLDNKNGYIDVDNVINWMAENVNNMYADYWIWYKLYNKLILINPEFSITINFFEFSYF